MFDSIGGRSVCHDCLKKQDELLDKVKGYIAEHPTARIEEVAKTCGVSANDIRKWAKEERLSFPEESPIRIYCEKCGTSIKSGRYCEKCR